MINTTNLVHGTRDEVWNTQFKDRVVTKDKTCLQVGEICSNFAGTSIQEQLEEILSVPGQIGRVSYLERVENDGGPYKLKIKNEWVHLVAEKTQEIEVDIEDATFLSIAKMAHERDITINDMMVEILKEQLEKEESKTEEERAEERKHQQLQKEPDDRLMDLALEKTREELHKHGALCSEPKKENKCK